MFITREKRLCDAGYPRIDVGAAFERQRDL